MFTQGIKAVRDFLVREDDKVYSYFQVLADADMAPGTPVIEPVRALAFSGPLDLPVPANDAKFTASHAA